MPAIDELAQQADSFEFHKKHFGGFLMGKNAKKSFANWERATQKGATSVQPLVERNFDDNPYAVLAFSTSGDIDADTLAELRVGAEQLAAENNLRAHGFLYNGVCRPWDGGDLAWVKEKPQFRSLSRPDQGIYTVPVQLLGSDGTLPIGLLWAVIDGELYISMVYSKE